MLASCGGVGVLAVARSQAAAQKALQEFFRRGAADEAKERLLTVIRHQGWRPMYPVRVCPVAVLGQPEVEHGDALKALKSCQEVFLHQGDIVFPKADEH